MCVLYGGNVGDTPVLLEARIRRGGGGQLLLDATPFSKGTWDGSK